MIDKVGGSHFTDQFTEVVPKSKGASTDGKAFLDVLKDKQGLGANQKADKLLKLSQHALERIHSRGIQMNQQKMDRLNEALQKAESKGAKQALVLMDSEAFILSVKDQKVVTAMNQDALKEHVFTNIDSTIMM